MRSLTFDFTLNTKLLKHNWQPSFVLNTTCLIFVLLILSLPKLVHRGN